MDFDTPIVFRFKILPFLKDRILPRYLESLRKESNSILLLNEEESTMLKKYANLVESIYHVHVGNFTNAVDVKTMFPFFEVMEKHVNIFSNCLKKINIEEEEKEKVLNHFDDECKRVIYHILS